MKIILGIYVLVAHFGGDSYVLDTGLTAEDCRGAFYAVRTADGRVGLATDIPADWREITSAFCEEQRK